MAWVHIDDEKAEALQDRIAPEDLITDAEMEGGSAEEDSAPMRTHYTPPTEAELYATKNRWIAVVLAWLLGSLGAHKFYMGYTKQGLILLACTIAGSLLAQVNPWLVNIASGAYFVAFVEGIIYIVRGKEGFYYTYEKGHRGWF